MVGDSCRSNWLGADNCNHRLPSTWLATSNGCIGVHKHLACLSESDLAVADSESCCALLRPSLGLFGDMECGGIEYSIGRNRGHCLRLFAVCLRRACASQVRCAVLDAFVLPRKWRHGTELSGLWRAPCRVFQATLASIGLWTQTRVWIAAASRQDSTPRDRPPATGTFMV